MVQQCGVAYLCTRALASLTLNSILACQPPAQSAPILAAKWQDDHDNGDDKCDANNDDNGDSNDDNDYGNDDEARQRCKLFLCKLFPSRHWLQTAAAAVKHPDDDTRGGDDDDGNADCNGDTVDDGSLNDDDEDDRNVQTLPVTP